MGIYYITFFENATHKIDMGSINPLIDSDDESRGYVKKEDILRMNFGITAEMILPNSFVVEYVGASFGPGIVESKRLPVRWQR